MSPLDLAGAALLTAGRHRYAPKVLIGLLVSVLVVSVVIGLRTSPVSRAEVLGAPLPTSGSGEVPGSGEGTITGTTGGRFLLAVSDATPSLRLGKQDQLRIALTNPTDQTLTLQTVTTTVLDPAAPSCLAQWLVVGDYDSAADEVVTIPAGGTSVVGVPIRLDDLPNVNQDACQGARIPIRLTGTASVT